jgi:hypothetical protein
MKLSASRAIKYYKYMPTPPAAIIFMNNDINPALQDKIALQLSITDVMSGVEFDGRVSVDPNYPAIVENSGLRLLVLRDTLQDTTNRQYADVVIFVKGGLASILFNKYGPPADTFNIDRFTIYDLLINKNLPPGPPNTLPRPIKDLLTDYYDPSHVHDANPDNIFNNPEFLNRK